MIEGYVQGILSFSIVFVASFITLYSYMFLQKTVRHKERRPWEFLFIASVLFLIFEVVSLLSFLGILNLASVDTAFWSKIFEFLYSGFVLLAFISQHDLILNNHLILISKKEANDKEDKDSSPKKTVAKKK